MQMETEPSFVPAQKPVIPPPLSQTLLQIPWDKVFPVHLERDDAGVAVTIEQTTYDDVTQFLIEHWVEINSEMGEHPFLFAGMSERKKEYYLLTSDFLAFKKGGKTIGVYIGSTHDWSTYYMRYAWLMPQYRKGGMFSKLIKSIVEACKLGAVERVDVQVSPASLPSLIMYQKMQFNHVGFEVSERWGAMVKLTKLLRRENENVMLNQFFMGHKYQLEDRAEAQPEDRSGNQPGNQPGNQAEK